jgi:hypothetical protein
MVDCASIFRREPTFRAGPPRTSKPSPLHSTTAPAKSLDWKTPVEVFDEQLCSLQQPGVSTTD